MNELDQKINQNFAGLVVRKDLVKVVKGSAIVPAYVLEYLLGQYCASNDEATIVSGIATVKEILGKHYVHRKEAELFRSNIREKGHLKVIDKINAALNIKTDAYEAEFLNLGIKKVRIETQTIKQHPKLLVGGVWCIADLEYEFSDEKDRVPWILTALKPIQISSYDFEGYLEARKNFSTQEWIDFLIQSIGFNPEMFGLRSKLIQLVRLIPFCERNYNLIELGPKGTGKSHIYSEFSPHGMLISGGEVSVPKLFVNNSTGKIGLVGFWDCVAFDEFAGKQKQTDKALVDIMKNYMANKSFSRGVEMISAEASMVFVGNTRHTVPYMLKHSDLFSELPDKFYDSAFLDRLHFYIPGWEMETLRGDMFTNSYGFIVDYLAEILRSLRKLDFSDRYKEYFSLSSDISTRDLDGINKTFSGLMKLIFPGDHSSKEEVEELLRFAVEGRKRIKDQLLRLDNTYANVNFFYKDTSGNKKNITTLEEMEYPVYYKKPDAKDGEHDDSDVPLPVESLTLQNFSQPNTETLPNYTHHVFQENQKNISFEKLFGPYLKGALSIQIIDPYIRQFHQIRNFMEFLETVVKFKSPDDEVSVHLLTTKDDSRSDAQKENLQKIQDSARSVGINFSFKFDSSGTIHARYIQIDNDWKISLDRGLDIFHRYEMNDAFVFSNRLQEYRPCKAFEITYLKVDHDNTP
ncbi:MAG: BREX system Lon protease-like protein BrxL [Deltaproteobacteria bacterium]|jgi:ATP-dependent Lon protease|nr:BREX system Lon protease-like protein BrxL [Deltaproteobacteria bacterium]